MVIFEAAFSFGLFLPSLLVSSGTTDPNFNNFVFTVLNTRPRRFLWRELASKLFDLWNLYVADLFTVVGLIAESFSVRLTTMSCRCFLRITSFSCCSALLKSSVVCSYLAFLSIYLVSWLISKPRDSLLLWWVIYWRSVVWLFTL